MHPSKSERIGRSLQSVAISGHLSEFHPSQYRGHSKLTPRRLGYRVSRGLTTAIRRLSMLRERRRPAATRLACVGEIRPQIRCHVDHDVHGSDAWIRTAVPRRRWEVILPAILRTDWMLDISVAGRDSLTAWRPRLRQTDDSRLCSSQHHS